MRRVGGQASGSNGLKIGPYAAPVQNKLLDADTDLGLPSEDNRYETLERGHGREQST